MTDIVHCPIIHGGLQLYFKNTDNTSALANHCCLRGDLFPIKAGDAVWNDSRLNELRQINLSGSWAKGCENCRNLERTGLKSFRTGMLDRFGKHTNLPGPQRLDLMFDTSCNLSCQTCGPDASTTWQKYQLEHGDRTLPVDPVNRYEEVAETLKNIDLSCLQQVVFCGGETLLGSAHWQVAKLLTEIADPSRITLSFQTNGTQPIPHKYYDLCQQFELVKLHFSLDAIEEQFEYLRWPASWAQVTDNMSMIRDTAPDNVMFLIEETVSIFNLKYLDRLEKWIADNFSANREGDATDHTRHLANGDYQFSNMSNYYVDHMRDTDYGSLIPDDHFENIAKIHSMIGLIHIHDRRRKHDWKTVFPEVADFYRDYLKNSPQLPR